jgi:SAM-dependent methyltransferase
MSGQFQYGSHWDEVADVMRFASLPCNDTLTETLLRGCGDLEGKRVLEVGAGNGITALALAERGARVVGIDVAEPGVEMIREKVLGSSRGAALGDRISFRTMDARHLDFADGSFDLVTCSKVLWCLPELDVCLREFHRVLCGGGRLVSQLWGAPEECPLLLSGTLILTRFIASMMPAPGITGPYEITPELLALLTRRAGFSRILPTAPYHAAFKIPSSAEYWEILRVIATTAYYAYTLQSPAEQAAIDEAWAAETNHHRDASGILWLPLRWFICQAMRAA